MDIGIVRQLLRSLGVACLFAVAAASAQAPVDVRMALVIGNSSYAGAPLTNPANDATAMGQALRKLGFSVQVVRDANKLQMAQAVDALRERLIGQQGVAFIYYAGHGVQVDYENFLIPVDARITQESDVVSQALNVTKAIEAFAASGNRLSMVVLDACRDNPFKSRQSFAGLAPRDAQKGVFIAYATEPGNVAEDGDPALGNGLYTRVLLKELARPAATMDEVFKRVRFGVRRASGGRQIPSYSNGLDEDFGFERGFNVKTLNEQARATQFSVEKAHWDRIRKSANPDDYFDFIDAYPESSVGELAQAVLERLVRRQILAQAAPQETQQNPADNRFRKGDLYKMRTTIPGEPTRFFTTRVTDVTSEFARVADVFAEGLNGEYTIAGAVIDDGVSTYDPPYVLIPGGEYQVGKRWSGRTIRTYKPSYLNGVKQWVDYSARVVTREKVVVPAGTFDTYRVEYSFQSQNGLRLQSILWVQPEWGISIKAVYQAQNSGTGLVRTVTREMLERHRGS